MRSANDEADVARNLRKPANYYGIESEVLAYMQSLVSIKSKMIEMGKVGEKGYMNMQL